MTTVVLTLVFLAGSAFLIFRIGAIAFNPALITAVCWLPALCLAMLPVTVDLKIYSYLNNTPSSHALSIIALALLGVAAGAYAVHSIALPNQLHRIASPLYNRDWIVPIAYTVGILTFLYAYWQSGLLAALCGTPTNIAESRQNFHIRHISLLVILMDLSAIVVAARTLTTGKTWLIIPSALPIILYLLTLQKSRVIFMMLCLIFVGLIFRKEAQSMFLSSARRVFVLIGVLGALAGAMYTTNLIRGVGVLDPNSASTFCAAPVRTAPVGHPPAISVFFNTNTDSRVVEQAFIYLGAPAIRNFAATIDGTVASEAPSYGRVAIRTLLWPFVDRETLNPTRHLGGINNGTALVFYWHDFGIVGVAAFSVLAGMMALLAFRLAQQRSLFGILAGAIAFNACAMSVFTDMFFEPLTAVQLSMAALLHFGSNLEARLGARFGTVST